MNCKRIGCDIAYVDSHRETEMLATAKKPGNRTVSRLQKESTLLHATKDFVSLPRPGVRDVAKYKELFYPLCMNANRAERTKISNLLADCPFTPRPIALFLAMDAIEIARPILAQSPVLTGRDFVALSSRNLPEHLLAASKRGDLDAVAVEAMLASEGTPDKPILQALIENEKLIGNFEVQALLRRAVVTVENAETEAVIEGEFPDFTLLEPDNTTDLSEALLSLSSVGGKLGDGGHEKDSRERIIDPQVVHTMVSNLRSHDHFAFSHQIYTLCRIGRHQTMAAIQDQDGGFLSVLLKANGVPRPVAARILLLLIPDLGRNVQVFRRVSEGYANMNQSECIAFLESRGADFTKAAKTSVGAPDYLRDSQRREKELSRKPAQVAVGEPQKFASNF